MGNALFRQESPKLFAYLYIAAYSTHAKPCVMFGCFLCFALCGISAVLRDSLLIVLVAFRLQKRTKIIIIISDAPIIGR